MQAMTAAGSAGMLSVLRPGHHEIDFAATALRTYQPLALIESRRVRAVSSNHLGGVGVDLVPACLAPYDQPHARGGGVPERHRRARVGVHRHPAGYAVRCRGPLNRSLRPSFCE